MGLQLKRRQARINAFIAMFEISFGQSLDDVITTAKEDAPEYAVDKFGESLLRFYFDNSESIDLKIETKLKGWKVSRLPRVNLAILRLAVAEMFQSEEDMDSVFINEAVEISKIYGDEGDYQFINGVLGNISRELRQNIPDNSSGQNL